MIIRIKLNGSLHIQMYNALMDHRLEFPNSCIEYLSIKIFIYANSVDPNEMHYIAASLLFIKHVELIQLSRKDMVNCSLQHIFCTGGRKFKVALS